MKGLVALLLSILLAMICWGIYGPVLQEGRAGMGGSSLKPFICVGLAYFLIAVVAPVAALRMWGESGHWSTTGIIWSLVAGAVGAIGALGVILALAFHGSPVYVMPLVFGGAPVVNTFLTMYWTKTFKQVKPTFIAGLILVIVGAVTVLTFRPHGSHAPAAAPTKTAATTSAGDDAAAKTRPALGQGESTVARYSMVMLFTLMTALAWGSYGPTLHRGQTAMAGSRLRPLICVGMSYFLIAVLVPMLLLTQWTDQGEVTASGAIWSLLGGASGAVGALGIILAFTFGGKPIFVMPLVFGGAPVINTFVSVTQAGQWGDVHSMFYAGLIVVIAGAVTVLVFAPKPAPHAAPAKEPAAEPASA